MTAGETTRPAPDPAAQKPVAHDPAAHAPVAHDDPFHLARSVAHELRTPLSGIASAVQLLRFRATEDPVVERNVGRIMREIERLGRIATALEEYGHAEPPRLAPGDPDEVWDRVIADRRGLLESSALVLHRTRAEPPARCRLDPARLAQLFGEVLANAAESAPEATDISLESEAAPGAGWRCRLHNGGPAVPPSVLPLVFEPLVSTRSGGTGMGLAVGRRIVAEHGGTIALESDPERGTTVTITLPEA